MPARRLSAKVVGVLHFEAALLARLGAAQVLGELRNGILSANLHHDLVHFDGLGIGVLLAFLGRALKADDGKVAIRQRTFFLHGAVGGVLLPQVIERVFHVLFAHVGVEP